MRITRETMLKFAKDTVAQRVRINHRLVCIYLTGSMLQEDSLLGGSGDIDLFFIHEGEPPQSREIVPLTDEVHLDIAHLSAVRFKQPRNLRADAWLGSFLYSVPIPLHDTNHWFEFTQAATGAQFNSAEYVLQRAHPFSERARQIWLHLQTRHLQGSPEEFGDYLRALEAAANSFAVLSGPPLSERRFLLNLPARAKNIQRPGLAVGFSDLFSTAKSELADWSTWLQACDQCLQDASLSPTCPPRLSAPRRFYFTHAAAALFAINPLAALWLLLRTWTQALMVLPTDYPGQIIWTEALKKLDLSGPAFETRLTQLDVYLDSVEESLDVWGRQNGISAE